MINDAQLEKLKAEIIQLGFHPNAASQLDIYRYSDSPGIIISATKIKGDDHLLYALHYEKDVHQQYYLSDYVLTVGNIPAPENYAALNAKLIIADEKVNKYYADEDAPGDQEYFEAVYDELTELHQSDPAAAEQLMFKFWPEDEYKKFIADDSPLKQKYLMELKVEIAAGQVWTADESYQYLKTSMKEHVLSDELLATARTAIAHGNVYAAYNDIPYFLDTGDVSFFKTHDEAHEFSMNNISEYDNYNIIVAHSIDELLRLIPYGEVARIQLIINKNNLPMNENNLKYLQDNIKYHGFGETLNPLLEEQIKKGVIEFTLPYKVDVNKREMEATLHFKKSDTTDMYFFNKYDAKVKNEKDEDMAQTFYINKGTGVTLKEAYNLLNGRAVYKELTNKEDQKYKAWIQLDFSAKDKHGNYERKPYHDNYGYDLKEALSYFPIKEMMKEDAMKDLLRSLEKGNVQMVTLAMPDKDLKVFIEACPKYKNINVYDNRMKPLVHEHKEELMKKPEMKEDQTKDQKQSLGQEDKDGKKQTGGRKKNDDLENRGLVKKKNNNPSKGMGVH